MCTSDGTIRIRITPFDPHRTHVRKKAEIGNMPAAVIEHFGRQETFGKGCF